MIYLWYELGRRGEIADARQTAGYTTNGEIVAGVLGLGLIGLDVAGFILTPSSWDMDPIVTLDEGLMGTGSPGTTTERVSGAGTGRRPQPGAGKPAKRRAQPDALDLLEVDPANYLLPPASVP